MKKVEDHQSQDRDIQRQRDLSGDRKSTAATKVTVSPRTRGVIEKYVPLRAADLPAYAAASEELTAAAVVDADEGE